MADEKDFEPPVYDDGFVPDDQSMAKDSHGQELDQTTPEEGVNTE